MKTELIAGIAEEVILDFAEVGQYDLMVVGIHSKDESENWFGRFMTEIISKARTFIQAEYYYLFIQTMPDKGIIIPT